MNLISAFKAEQMLWDLFEFISQNRLPVSDPNLDHYLYREISGQAYACIIDGLQFKNNTVWRRFKSLLRRHIGWFNAIKIRKVRDTSLNLLGKG